MSCEYCHEDRDGYICPLDKNAHAYYHYPDTLILRFGKERRECKINYCPMCGRKLGGNTDNKRMTNGEKIRQMTDEELANYLDAVHFQGMLVGRKEIGPFRVDVFGWFEWLKEEAKDGST